MTRASRSNTRTQVQHCQLGPDLKVLPAGDSTEIGERGITLSGGQKSRVAIARACYDIENTELFLFDDSLSALDVHVGTKIFKHVLTGMLAEKTRILVLSSQYHLLQHADRVVVMEDGECVYCGDPPMAITKYEHLFGKLKFIKEKKGNDDDDDEKDEEVSKESTSSKSLDKSGVLYEKEDRKTGSVGIVRQCLSWFSMVDGSTYRVALLVFLLFISTQICRTTSDIFLASWGSNPTKNRFGTFIVLLRLSKHTHIYYTTAIYGAIVALVAILTLARSLVFVHVACSASKNFHNRVLQSVMRAPINKFFDVVPTGVILNRFSSDLDHIDVALPEFAAQFFQNSLYVVAAVILCASSSYFFLVALIPLFLTYAYVRVVSVFVHVPPHSNPSFHTGTKLLSKIFT